MIKCELIAFSSCYSIQKKRISDCNGVISDHHHFGKWSDGWPFAHLVQISQDIFKNKHLQGKSCYVVNLKMATKKKEVVRTL